MFLAVALSTVLPATAFTATSISWSDGFIEGGPTPACPADLFDALVTVTCHQGERSEVAPLLLTKRLYVVRANCYGADEFLTSWMVIVYTTETSTTSRG